MSIDYVIMPTSFVIMSTSISRPHVGFQIFFAHSVLQYPIRYYMGKKLTIDTIFQGMTETLLLPFLKGY